MNIEMNNRNEPDRKKVDDRIGGVLSNASPRPTPHTRRKEEAYRKLRGEWQAGLSAKKHTRRLVVTGIAASIVATAALSLQVGLGPSSVAPELKATLARSAGSDITLNGQPIGDRIPVNAVLQFHPDDRLSTGASAAVSIAWNATGSLRLASSSSLVFSSGGGVELVEGRIYYDSKSHDGQHSTDIIVDTPYGRIHHVGTQFVAAVGRAGVNISVREGEVTFGMGVNSVAVKAGQSALINADLEPFFSPVDSIGEEWTWASQIAPLMDIDGHSTREIIGWLAKETGHVVVYETIAAEEFAVRDSIFGIGETDPVNAIRIIGLATELQFTVENEILRVGLKRK